MFQAEIMLRLNEMLCKIRSSFLEVGVESHLVLSNLVKKALSVSAMYEAG